MARNLESRFGVLIVALLTIAMTAQAQRRGGGGDGGGDGEDDSNNDSGGSSRDDTHDWVCNQYAQYEDPNFLHRWIGSYYNGTIEVTMKLNESWVECEEQEREAHHKFDGVLSVLDSRYNGIQNMEDGFLNPFIFTLVGWPEDTNQSQLFGPRKEQFLPQVTEFNLESETYFRMSELWRRLDQEITRFNGPACEVTNLTRVGRSLEFDCDYSAHYTDTDMSRWVMPMSTCNSTGADNLGVQMANEIPAAPGVYEDLWPSEVGNSLSGSFGPSEADFRWEGYFRAAFEPFGDRQYGKLWKYDDELKYGTFEMHFQGKLDKEHSYEMGAKSDGAPVWYEDTEKIEAAHYCPKSWDGGLVKPSGGAIVIAAALAAWIARVI